MSRPVNPFDPFGFFAAGPFAMFQAGLEMMQVWQRAMLPMLSLPPRPTQRPGQIISPWQFAGLIPRVDSRVTPVTSDRAAARPPAPARLPDADERQSVEAQIALRQGRADPWLGCLQGAEIVYPEVPAVEDKPSVDRPVLDSVVDQARIVKPRAAVVAKTAPAKKAAAKAAPTGEKKTVAARKARIPK